MKSETQRRISKEAQEMSVYKEKGSVIITLHGSIGRIAITQYNTYVDRTLLFFESFIVPFDKFFFMLSIFRLFELEKEKAPGGIIKTITKEALSSFKFIYPKIEEQTEIATILLDMDKQITALETKLEKYKKVKLGMMQNLITGKIRLVCCANINYLICIKDTKCNYKYLYLQEPIIIKAMNQAIEALEKLPLSNRLLKQTHKTLLQGVRGTHKLPGEFRQSQNWIGGSSLADATFIPPYQDNLADLMTDLEKFLHNENIPVPHLIKVGIAHYQFETIHPFLDGNGRIGRLLITLYLVSNNLLHKPTLYLSDFFEKNKALYYDNLTRVRTHNDLTQWLKYFLEGVRSTSENSIQTFKSIIKLRSEAEHKIMSLGKKQALAKTFLQFLYSKPIADAGDIAEALEINVSTALRLIDDFVKLNILKEVTGFKRNRIFAFDDYIKLFR